MDVTVNALKKKHADNKHNVGDGFSLRIYRAISWLAKANDLAKTQESDLAFVTLWISFNALYADELPLSQNRGISDKSPFKDFIRKIGKYDKQERLYDLIWNRYPQSIRTLLNNQYAFTPFWQYQNGTFSKKAWEEDFDKDKKQALKYLSDKNNTDLLLTIVFERLYTIRNQIVHGGATYASSVNRKQVKDAVNILGDFLPLIIDIMMNHPEQDWGKPFYPPVDEASFD